MFIKLLVTTFIAIATYNINAIECEDFKVQLTEKQYFDKLDELCYQKEFRDVGIRIFRKYWAMHLMELRNKKKSDILRWDNLRYAETLLNVIPTELARAIFNVNSKQFQYNIMDDKILEIKGCNPAIYNSSNWNYIVLINVIDKILNGDIKEIVETKLAKRKWFTQDTYLDTISYCDKSGKYHKIKTVDTIIDETINNILKTYSQYKKNILKAKHDILCYFKELELDSILNKIRNARFYLVKSLDKNSISNALEDVMKDDHKITAYMDWLPKLRVMNETMELTEELLNFRKEPKRIKRAKCVLYNVEFSGITGIKSEYSVIKCIEYNRGTHELTDLDTTEINENFYTLMTKLEKTPCCCYIRDKHKNKKDWTQKAGKNFLWEFVYHLFSYTDAHNELQTGLKNVDYIYNEMLDTRNDTTSKKMYEKVKKTVKFFENEKILEEKAPVSRYIYLIELTAQLGNNEDIKDTLTQIEQKLVAIRKKVSCLNDFEDMLYDIVTEEMNQTICS